ncbi:HAD family hydrolase [Corallococcus sicarius]|uniref:HAD family hydrolase n=1 Tax=Corallococcus sicarius TaxID=2316726 RepID=A0A3A8NTC8_9BACT|nr:HAD family hydrolase [Corallococcus sicarius]
MHRQDGDPDGGRRQPPGRLRRPGRAVRGRPRAGVPQRLAPGGHGESARRRPPPGAPPRAGHRRQARGDSVRLRPQAPVRHRPPGRRRAARHQGRLRAGAGGLYRFLAFTDPPKEGAREAIPGLSRRGVDIKLITGDSRRVAEHVAREVGLGTTRVLTGAQLHQLSDEALWHQAERAELFVEVDPTQKERIILALKKQGHVVGFLGDGVNDAPAMHAADASLCVQQAADVAREAADFVLLERHLDVVRRGIDEGRRTFANTLKYILTTTSANLGNMVSMAAASLFLPFLPLLAGQILLNNFLSDIPAVGLAGDSVDPELMDRPRRWNMRLIARFMVAFGLLSAVFDFLTFGALPSLPT